MKKIISILFITILIMTAMAVPVNAACTLSVSRSSAEVLVDKTVTVTFTFKDSVTIGGFDITIEFDTSKLTYVSASDSLGSGTDQVTGKTIRSIHYNNGSTSTSAWLKLTFKTKAVGTASVSIIKNNEVTDTVGEFLGAPTASTTISIKEENKSNNANLKWLTVPSGCTLVPKFSKSVTSYTCTVPYSVSSFPMDWETEDKDATTSVTKLQTLKVGENSRTVTVTAPDGTKKSYTVKIIREQQKATPTPTVKPSSTATPTASTTATPTSAPVTVTIDDVQYTVSSAITLILPENFEKENFTYNSVQVETAVLGNVRLIQLYDGTRDSFFVYDTSQQSFTPYRHMESQEKGYVVIDKKPELSMELKEQHIVIGNGEYVGWTADRFGEGYYLLNVVNSKGENYPALYCKEDGSIQKLSLTLLENVPVATETPAVGIDAPTAEPTSTTAAIYTPQSTEQAGEEEKSFFEKINPVYIGIAVCIILLIAIIVVIIVLIAGNDKHQNRKHDWGFEDDNNSFNFVVEDVETTDAVTNNEEDDFE